MEDQHRTADLEARVRRAIGEAVEVAPEALDPTSPVYQEEGLVGGLHLVQACWAIEKEFHIDIPDEHAERLLTLGDFTDYVYCRLTGQELPWAEADRRRATSKSAQTASSSTGKVGRKRKERSVTPETASEHASPSFHAWKFDLGRWEAVEDVVYRGSQEETFDVEEALRHLRYDTQPALVMGTHEQGIRVEVYDGAQKDAEPPDYAFYVKLWVGRDVESVYVTNLPSLITLLSRLGSIVGNVQAPGEKL